MFLQFFPTDKTDGISLLDNRVSIRAKGEPLGKVFGTLMLIRSKYWVRRISVWDRDHSDYDFATNILTQTNNGKPGTIAHFATCCQIFHARSHFITVDATEPPLSEVLDTIVNQMANYKWEVNDGVVNIFPSKGRDSLLAQFVALDIAVFSLNGDVRIESLKGSFGQLPEVKLFLVANNLQYNNSRVIVGDLDTPLDPAPAYSHIKMLDLLNKISKAKRGGWILRARVVKNSSEVYLDLDI